MPCYHPQLLKYDGKNINGKNKYIFTGQQGFRTFTPYDHDSRDILVPCRQCIGCRLDYSRRWADRLMLELDHSKTALFLTLTYDDEHITPAMYDDNLQTWWFTLVKKDLQDFNKRLRYYFEGKEIRFYAVGEYGDQTLRPHYHGIYFGLSLDDFPDADVKFYNDFHQPIYESPFLAKIWQNGLCSLANVSWQSCAYVARYNLKKLGARSDGLAESRNCIPEFSLMSRNKGIGAYFVDDHPDVLDNPRDKIILSDNYGVRRVGSISLPDFLFKKLELINPELYAKIKEEKQIASNERFLAELSKTHKDEYDYLVMKENQHGKGAQKLIRKLE